MLHVQAIDWLSNTDWEKKYDFFCSMLGTLKPEEVKTLGNMCQKTKRVMKTKDAGTPAKKARNEPEPPSESAPSMFQADAAVIKILKVKIHLTSRTFLSK